MYDSYHALAALYVIFAKIKCTCSASSIAESASNNMHIARYVKKNEVFCTVVYNYLSFHRLLA